MSKNSNQDKTALLTRPLLIGRLNIEVTWSIMFSGLHKWTWCFPSTSTRW